ncbi:MAG TPA: MlaD family protein [Terriglobales bacterium]
MPSQQQVKWSQLRVGATVIFASTALLVLVFLMGGTGGFFSRKITVHSYFQNASGLTVGAPVRLQGVDVGNVKTIRIDASRRLTPVEVTMKLSMRYVDDLYENSTASLSTAGVLGATYVDIDSSHGTGKHLKDGQEIKTTETPDIQDVIKSSQTTLQNMNVILGQLNDVVGAIQNGQGSFGKLIYDPALFNRANQSLAELQKLINAVGEGQGSLGKLINDDEMYNKLNSSIDKLNGIVDQVNRGQGSLGKLVKDPSLYNNANQTIAKANRLMDDINAGRGTLGKLASDQEFARKIDLTVTRLAMISERLEAGQGSAGLLLKNPSLYNNADQMLVETRGLVKAIRENPKKYLVIHFKIF